MTTPNCLSTAPGILAADLTIDGLALCCFNQTIPSNKFWEVAYPRHRKHSLAITIDEVVIGRQRDRTIVSNYPVPRNLESFNVRLDTGTNDIYQGFPHGGCRTGNFNRTGAGNDPNDIRWMIDVAGSEPDHGTVTLKPKGGGRVGVTLARLHHSLFFTRRPSAHPVKLTSRCGGDPADYEDFGPTNREMGALMKAPTPGKIVFEGINIHTSQPLDFDASKSYKIKIINEDKFSSEHWPGHVKGDFHFLYDIIAVTGAQKELWAVPDDEKVAPDGDCNPNGFGGSTLEPLIS
ncbi:MAG: hypothetical protein ABW250_09840 [Pyrinomonadaceae bacterium]